MLRTIYIRRHERGLLFDRGDFIGVLQPGRHFVFGWNKAVEIADTLKTRFEHPLLEVMLANAELQRELRVLELTDTQRAVVWKNGRAFAIVGPGRHAFWTTPALIEIETFSIDPVRFDHPKLPAILQLPEAAKFLDGVQVSDNETALLFRDGVLIEQLGQGLHVFWKGNGNVKWKALDLREQVADVAGQEIITADKVSLRVNLVVTWAIVDPLLTTRTSASPEQALYREAQLALRAAVGTKVLDALLADKEAVGGEVRAALAARAGELGLSVRSVGLRDIVLPGEMKTLLNQVIAATKEAEAGLIRRREETAQVRSQLNTAKLLAENPQLQRLKELEVLKDVLAGTTATFVLGQGDLTDQIRTLVTAR
ncbi:MAG: FtsH protease regulator HflK [Phycisphaerales bacterium]|nr:FtsH protease regulator HflK [Phycisphaerales bacterium]